jgi:hypothetical protein
MPCSPSTSCGVKQPGRVQGSRSSTVAGRRREPKPARDAHTLHCHIYISIIQPDRPTHDSSPRLGERGAVKTDRITSPAHDSFNDAMKTCTPVFFCFFLFLFQPHIKTESNSGGGGTPQLFAYFYRVQALRSEDNNGQFQLCPICLPTINDAFSPRLSLALSLPFFSLFSSLSRETL